MRTTLKRGIGRGASANGNGRAVYPPGVLTPMQLYRVPPRERSTRRLVTRIALSLLAAIVMVVVGLAGGAYLYSHETLNAFEAKDPIVKRAAKKLLTPTVPSASEPATALVIGYDKRAGADAAIGAGSRSDTIMLLRADPGDKTVSLLSFPRDLEVPIYCKGTIVATDRINSAWSRCNAEGTLATIEHLTGVHPNYLITVDFHGFKLLVNKLHGVYMNVDHRYLNTHGGPGGYATINLEPGYQKLDGEQALDFVRFRHTDSDLYRLARQQLFVTALRDRLGSSFSIFDVPKIIGALKGNVTIAQGGGGSVPMTTALAYIQFAHGLSSGHFFRNAIDRNELSGIDTLTAPQSAIDEAVRSFEHPDIQAPRQANRAALGLKPIQHKAKLKPAQISTLVLNGTTVAGLAGNTSYKLAQLGYRTVELTGQQPANAPSQAYTVTNIYYDPLQADAKLAAKQLQPLIKGSIVGPLPLSLGAYARSSGNPQTVIVLGQSFDGNLTLPETSTAPIPKHQPAQVFASPGASLEPIRAVARRLPFRPMVPHVIENRSSLSQLEPVRVYTPTRNHKALVLTYVTGPGNVYWQVEETDWNTAPILAHPTVSRTMKGRHFDFYYAGSHLHMVVLRTPKATYWVVNTLLDELSNETMIAIARGLEPLGK
jgi:LCP family protein required for cell wall assembly